MAPGWFHPTVVGAVGDPDVERATSSPSAGRRERQLDDARPSRRAPSDDLAPARRPLPSRPTA